MHYFISTHVSVRRRTSILERKARNSTISIHVSLGRRTNTRPSFLVKWIFQLTSPQGDEQYRLFTTISRVDFNSRLREETNRKFLNQLGRSNVFQLTSPQGDEPSGMFSFSQLRYFNSRLRKETNDPLTVLAPPFYLFQFTSPQGDEHKSLVAVLINQLNFNSRLRKETNLSGFLGQSNCFCISTHVSVRRRTTI